MNNNLILLVLLLRKPSQQIYDILTEYLKIDNVMEIPNNPTLQNTILSHIEPEFLHKTTMNKFHKIIGESLRDAQQKQSGSVVDLFVRNMLLLFNQMDFQQLIKTWEDFKICQDNYLQNNQFLTESYIEYLLNQLQDCSSYVNLDEIKQIIEQPIFNENCKVNHLKALLYAIMKYPFKAMKYSRKYYDMSLNALVPKKVNHCIMNSIQLNMKMNYYDEALNSLSEGLRLSQTVSDEQSINLCLLNLFEIAYRNNYQKQATLLLEYAVNHAQQLNPQYRLQNSLIYGSQIRFKAISHSLLKKKNINWKDIIHQSIKQILQSQFSDIEQALSSYLLITSKAYGNSTLMENSLDRVQQFKKNDQSLALQLESLQELYIYQPLFTLQKIQEFINKTYNLNDQLTINILNTCLNYFKIINDQVSIQYIKSLLINLLDLNPDPYYQESLELIPFKNPQLKVQKLLQSEDNDIEIIKLCKQYSLKQQYLDYKLKKIENLVQNEKILEAQQQLNLINLENLSQANLKSKALFWNLMAQTTQNVNYYQVSINLAVQIGWLELIQQNYYLLAFLFDDQDKQELRDQCAQKFNNISKIIEKCQQNTNLVFFKAGVNEIVEYLYRFLTIIQQEYTCKVVDNIIK